MSQKRSQSGFTLVEVLAALAVFSIAAIGLSQSTGEATRGSRHMEAKFLAGVVAENRLIEAVVDPAPLVAGAKTGTDTQRGRQFDWTRLVGPTSRPDVVSISVTVQDPATEQVLVRLDVLRQVKR